ncbi:MAG: hypothetical protein ACRDT4_01670 [Micromonosporaceae bacterium]
MLLLAMSTTACEGAPSRSPSNGAHLFKSDPRFDGAPIARTEAQLFCVRVAAAVRQLLGKLPEAELEDAEEPARDHECRVHARRGEALPTTELTLWISFSELTGTLQEGVERGLERNGPGASECQLYVAEAAEPKTVRLGRRDVCVVSYDSTTGDSITAQGFYTTRRTRIQVAVKTYVGPDSTVRITPVQAEQIRDHALEALIAETDARPSPNQS